jgi:putative acetyltransferase
LTGGIVVHKKQFKEMNIPSLSHIVIRPITAVDNPHIAAIIRSSLAEFGANKPGTVFTDPTTDDLFSLFQRDLAYYFVAEYEGSVLGGGGIFPSDGLPADTCELVKMYLIPKARGAGLGKKIITLCLEKAEEYGFRKVYIETMPELKKAVSVYERFGFTHLKGPMGNTGHFGCDVWMIFEPSGNRKEGSLHDS